MDQNQIDECARVAKEFSKLYYENIDKKKVGHKLYMENSILAWNGNCFRGESISKFYNSLPTTCHQIATLDAQQILEGYAGISYIIQVSGTVKFNNQNSRAFQQSFLITADGNKWKVVSDTFRVQDGMIEEIKLE